MGYQVVKFIVGTERTPFTFHKNLIAASGGKLGNLVSSLGKNEALKLPSVAPGVFILFAEYLYKKEVPGLDPASNAATKGDRLVCLGLFFIFAEDYEMVDELRNKIMDRIQDVYRILNKFPRAIDVEAVYNATKPESLLRKFFIVGFLSGTPVLSRDAVFMDWCKKEPAARHDLMPAAEIFQPPRNFRIRDGKYNHPLRYVRCFANRGRRGLVTGEIGVSPCAFHIHEHNVGDNGEPGIRRRGKLDGQPVRGCHLYVDRDSV